MANNKEIVASILSGTSEVVANKLLAAAGIDKKAAEIVRDTNGKVIKVIVTLPPTAAEAAVTAIAATPGVADVQVTDISESQEGYDGSQVGWNNLLDNGYTLSTFGDGVFTDNLDGTTTYSSASSNAAADALIGHNKAPIAPLPMTLEIKCALGGTYTDGHSPISLSVQDGLHSYALYVYKTAGTFYVGLEDNTAANHDPLREIEITPGTSTHVYKLVLDETGLAKVYMDDVEKFTWQVGISPSSNYVILNPAAFGTGTITIDFARWTRA